MPVGLRELGDVVDGLIRVFVHIHAGNHPPNLLGSLSELRPWKGGLETILSRIETFQSKLLIILTFEFFKFYHPKSFKYLKIFYHPNILSL